MTRHKVAKQKAWCTWARRLHWKLPSWRIFIGTMFTKPTMFFCLQSCQFNTGRCCTQQWIGSNRIDDTIDGIPIVKPRVSKRQIQQYKVIISMKGNDVASGLKWSLLSESVLLMPKTTQTLWAMEELLEEWVHYIPMYSNGSNAEAMIQWVGNNDLEAW